MTNHLAAETSPYLKMHAENPVDWFPWGKEAIEKAKKEDKPILLSIGYTACHWCHVMAHESFEDFETAQLMNNAFINIKVDREERPDLDKIYQLSAQLLTRQVGGWPLTVFLMPETQIPFFAGTYFPKIRRGNFPSFKEVIQYVQSVYQQHKDQLQQQNSSFQNIIKELEDQGKQTATAITEPLLQARNLLEKNYDVINSGFGNAPKFPMTTNLYLLLLFAAQGDLTAEKMLTHTLEKMFNSGIYDQIGNGFFRYTVDEKWQIPHFEKMLYDNALLLALFSETYAFKVKSNHEQDFLKKAIIGTADWIIKEMQGSGGGYYATLAADTEGKEGKFYVWNREEIKDALTEAEYEVISLYYGLDSFPNFEHSWHVQVRLPIEELVKKINKSADEVKKIISTTKEKLYLLRSKKTYPERDEKVIVSWNGLTIKAMSLAGLYLRENKFIDSAEKCLNFIANHLWSGNKLYSVYKDGTIKHSANLDDYVFLIEGIIYLLQARWSTEHFNFLMKLIFSVVEHFEDRDSGGFYFTANDHEKLIYRIKQYTDESLPSSNAIITKLLSQVGFLLGDDSLLQAAENSLKNAMPHIQKYPDAYCSFLASLAFYFDETQIIFVRANKIADWLHVYLQNYQPNRLAFFIQNEEILSAPLDLKKPDGDAIAYLCKGKVCMAPIKKLQDFEHELQSNKFRVAG